MERTALSEKKNHYPWLDAMRLIASAVVLLAHSRNDFFLSWYALPDSLRNVFTFLLYAVGRMGHEAVVVFFVLSGFLVLGRGLERIHNNTFDENNYAVDRAVRIGVPLGHGLACQVSAAWERENELMIYCHVIDMHLAQLRVAVSFVGDTVTLHTAKHAEFILQEYSGFASGEAEKNEG